MDLVYNFFACLGVASLIGILIALGLKINDLRENWSDVSYFFDFNHDHLDNIDTRHYLQTYTRNNREDIRILKTCIERLNDSILVLWDLVDSDEDYLLHPETREQSEARLRLTKNFQTTNKLLAHMYSTSVKVKDETEED